MSDKVLVPVEELREKIISIMNSHVQEMENYGYFSSNPGIDDDDIEEVADQIIELISGCIESAPEPVRSEPVAVVISDNDTEVAWTANWKPSILTRLYTHPPAQEWVKCSDCMPDLIGSYLALSGNTIYFAFYNSDGKWAHKNSFLTSVTHWMPLPSLPE